MNPFRDYKDSHRKVRELEERLRALREERTNLSEDDPRRRSKALNAIFKRQTTLVTKIGNASQKRNIALSAIEKLLREQVALESK